MGQSHEALLKNSFRNLYGRSVARADNQRCSMCERGERFPAAWNFFKGGAFGLDMRNPRVVRQWRTGSSPSMVMSEKIKPGEPPETAAANPEQVPDWLSNRLRRMFTEVMDEGVPDEFKALLKQLEDKERGS
jgi:hypothetical protein